MACWPPPPALTALLLMLCCIAPPATGFDPITTPSSTITTAVESVDLLAALGLYNSSWAGVTLTAGPQQLRPAYYLQGDYRDLRLPPAAFSRISSLLRVSPEFTFSAWLRQEEGNTGSIVSIADGSTRYLELQSSGRRNEIRLHYTSRVDSKVYVETFHYMLADNLWHHVAMSVSGSQAELLIDCHSMYKRMLRPGAPDRNFTIPQQIWLGQRNKHYQFKGAMQDVRLLAGPHGYLSLCPKLDSTCPTCGQFSLLQSTVQDLTRHLEELTERLRQAERRIARVEDCDCVRTCRVNGTVYGDGATWQVGCDVCTCLHGEVQCHPVECKEPDCKNPVKHPGECCPRCLLRCYHDLHLYDHGEVVSHKCVECKCEDGNMICSKIDPETCPELNCPQEEQLSAANSCCKFCPDIDECSQKGGLEGHHCNQNTTCVNTMGSYVCECFPGYRRLDKFNCAEIDECSNNEHNCDENANCINTQGSYQCRCKEGYTGDGYTCQPVCEQNCLNGGVCKSPGKCGCPQGYTGVSCERDLDECAADIHRCTNSSVCVNMIGWYYCKCKDGYQSPLTDNNLGNLCLDVDECEREIHSCHPTATCENSEGGFSCTCPPDSASCRLSCMFEGREVADGLSVSPEGDPCLTCTCHQGVMQCQKPVCDCASGSNDRNLCCPQCDVRYACQHQELPGVVLRHGEQWSYQCQSCECLYGEVDCWELRCPPLQCRDPVQAPGDCCPHCPQDLCAGNYTRGGAAPCLVAGRRYETGARFAPGNDSCVTCDCKNGVLCCSYNNDCGDDPQSVASRTPVGTGTVLPLPTAAPTTVRPFPSQRTDGTPPPGG